MELHFGSNTLDLRARELRCAGSVVDLEPRTFAVLAYLVDHRDRVVPREELLDEIWGDRFVGDSALSTQIAHLRQAVGDDGGAQRVIKTAHRVGYRFVAEVVGDREPPRDAATAVPVPPRWGRTTRLLGRDTDLEEVEQRLVDHPFVTVTGPGGVGKTALARAVVERLGPAAPDGAWICELADIRDPQSLGNAVLEATGQSQHSDADPVESLLRALEARQALLVLDNCEHVHEVAGALISELLRRCRGIRVLATSRVPLGIDGESIHPLSPLDPESAVACFVAAATDSGASIDTGATEVAELCDRLDRLPLAMELAAARARMLSPGEMLGLLTDRFRFLRDDARGDERHSSLRRAIEWSWKALAPGDQTLLAQLSVFVGTFTLDDVRAVALPSADPLDVVDAVGRLVGHSLVAPVRGRTGPTRFRLLESVRDFVAETLDDPEEVRRSHAEHFTDLAERVDAELQTEQIDGAVETMRAAWSNLRAAATHAADSDADLVRRLIRAVGPYADVFQAYEVLDWCERAGLAQPGTDPVASADALAIEARMLAHRGELATARARAEIAHEWCETHATALSLVWCAYYRGDLDLVVRLADRLHELSRSDRGFDRGFADGFAAIVATVRQEAHVSSTTVTPAHAERGLLGVQDCLVEGLRICTADPGRAAELFEAVVTSSIRRDYRLHLGAAASTLTQITLPAMPPTEAMRSLRRTLGLYLDRSMWTLISADTVMAARLLADHGDVETAARLLGARAASGYAVGLSELLRSALEGELPDRLGDRFTRLADEGAGWRPPEAGRCAVEALDRILADAG
jgi:predicted ATPase/DNA-binding winged helix-turn-helix (wHTH) protein